MAEDRSKQKLIVYAKDGTKSAKCTVTVTAPAEG